MATEVVLNLSTLPTQNEKSALLGEGTPSTTNRYGTKEYISSVVAGLNWQPLVDYSINYIKEGIPAGTGTNGERCLDIVGNMLYTYTLSWGVGLPCSSGDRFIFKDDGSDVSGDSGSNVHDDRIYEYDGETFSYEDPEYGYAVPVQEDSTVYFYNGVAFVYFIAIFSHNDLANKQGGTTSEYYHLTYDANIGINSSLTPISSSNPPTTIADQTHFIVSSFIHYRKSTPGAPSGTASSGEKCLNTNEGKLYTYTLSWDAGVLVTSGTYVHKDNGSDVSGDSGIHTANNKLYIRIANAFLESVPLNGFTSSLAGTLEEWKYVGSAWVYSSLTSDILAGIRASATPITALNPALSVADAGGQLTSDQLAGIQQSPTPLTALNPVASQADLGTGIFPDEIILDLQNLYTPNGYPFMNFVADTAQENCGYYKAPWTPNAPAPVGSAYYKSLQLDAGVWEIFVNYYKTNSGRLNFYIDNVSVGSVNTQGATARNQFGYVHFSVSTTGAHELKIILDHVDAILDVFVSSIILRRIRKYWNHTWQHNLDTITAGTSTWSNNNSISYITGGTWYQSPAAQNDTWLTRSFLLPAGEYTLTMVGLKINTCGILTLSTVIDAVETVIGTVDMYSAGTEKNKFSSVTFTLTETKTVAFKGACLSKNASSSGYAIYITYLCLGKTN